MEARKKGTGLMGATGKLKSFLYDGQQENRGPHNSLDSSSRNQDIGPPIADAYKMATVVFADIAGFTVSLLPRQACTTANHVAASQRRWVLRRLISYTTSLGAVSAVRNKFSFC